MSDELKPCPFCGAQAELYTANTAGTQWDIRCKSGDCLMAFGADWYLNKEEIIRLWNKRAPITDSKYGT